MFYCLIPLWNIIYYRQSFVFPSITKSMASLIPFTVELTHQQKVLRLYKRILRNLESWYYYRPVFRYQAVLLRCQFDKNKCVSEEEGCRLLNEAETELAKKTHYQIKQFPHTIGGNAYGRAAVINDSVLDYWHPLEKAQFPDYFSKREQRKLEYIKMWEDQYGKCNPPSENDH